MGIGELIFEISINLFEAWMCFFFLKRKLTMKTSVSRRMNVTITALSIGLYCACLSLSLWVEVSIVDTFFFAIPILYSLLMFSDRLIVKLAWDTCLIVVTIGIATLSSTAFMFITGESWEEFLEPSIQRYFIVLQSNLLIFFTLYIISRINIHQTRLSMLSILIYIVINLFLVASVDILFGMGITLETERQPIFAAVASTMLSAVGVLGLFEYLSFYAEKKSELESRLELDREKKAHQEEVQIMYNQILDYRHDLKHHFAIVEQMVKDHHIEKAERYLEKMQKYSFPGRFLTGNTAVDAILNLKSTQMKHAGIEFEYENYPLRELPLDESDFCTIIGNLLDNAIEANQRMKKATVKKVSLKIGRVQEILNVSCYNTADPDQIQMIGERRFLSSCWNSQDTPDRGAS